MADLIDRDALNQFYESGTDPKDTYADMTFIRAEHIKNAPAVNRWIPCSERLPESNISVLCAMRTGEFCIMEYDEEEQAWYEGIHDYRKHCVTYWMPLPEIPEPPEKE